jgi:hypothetical protein
MQKNALDYYGTTVFGPSVDCTPLMGEMMWATIIGSFLFTFFTGIGVYFILAIESTPRFETTRSRALIIPERNN